MFTPRKTIAVLVFGLVIAAYGSGQTPAVSPAPTAKTQHGKSSVVYVNRKYGFRFYLPQSWAGYTIIENNWSPENGGSILIRHPLWTEATPREDIPIMIFTKRQWRDVQREKLIVSTAPFPPSELGHNKRFVFALQARWDYDLEEGYEEAGKILNNGLKAFDP